MIWMIQISVFVTTLYLDFLAPYQSSNQHSCSNVAFMIFSMTYLSTIFVSLSFSLLVSL